MAKRACIFWDEMFCNGHLHFSSEGTITSSHRRKHSQEGHFASYPKLALESYFLARIEVETSRTKVLRRAHEQKCTSVKWRNKAKDITTTFT
jgi:hypothetical protein